MFCVGRRQYLKNMKEMLMYHNLSYKIAYFTSFLWISVIPILLLVRNTFKIFLNYSFNKFYNIQDKKNATVKEKLKPLE